MQKNAIMKKPMHSSHTQILHTNNFFCLMYKQAGNPPDILGHFRLFLENKVFFKN